jgi:chromosome segregation ATPase
MMPTPTGTRTGRQSGTKNRTDSKKIKAPMKKKPTSQGPQPETGDS